MFDERLRKANVACTSLTASSIEMPDPSLRISTPKILDAAWAPYSLEPARVMSKARIWSEYQGVASSFKPPTSGQREVVDLIDGGADRGTDRADD